MDNMFLGVDLGGTSFKVGRVRHATIEERTQNPVGRTVSEKDLINILYKSIDSVITPEVKGIGVGVPGVVDPIDGIIYDIQNLPGWKKIYLKKLLEERYLIPVNINNDANCFALGENYFGKGANYKNFVGLSIGTGLGMGIIIDNKLYNGVLCGAGEIGMVTYKESIIEHYAGSLFFANTYNRSAKEFSELAQKGDVMALQAFSEFGSHLGAAIKNVLYMYAPEAIVLGGSISKAYPLFEEAVNDSLKTFAYPKQIEDLKIEISDKEGLAILGAAALCI